MCGILCVFGKLPEDARKVLLQLSQRLRHRGPDWSGIDVHEDGDHSSILCHERLSIVDPAGEAQPLYNEDRSIVVSAARASCLASALTHCC